MTVCTIDHLFAVGHSLDVPDTASLTEYLSVFDAPLVRDGFPVCPCGARLGGVFGSFSWGLRNGEGQCSTCGREIRLQHRLTDADGEKLGSLIFPLLYRLTEAAETEYRREFCS